jgi:hypothetical protein
VNAIQLGSYLRDDVYITDLEVTVSATRELVLD